MISTQHRNSLARRVRGGLFSVPNARQPLRLPRSATDPQPLSQPPSASSLTRLKKEELQRRARAAGLPIHGTKAEIAARLAATQQQVTSSPSLAVASGVIVSPRGGWQLQQEGQKPPPSAGDQGSSNGASPPGGAARGHDILDPFSSKPILEALGEQLAIQQSKHADTQAEKWVGEISVMPVAGKGRAKKQGSKLEVGQGGGAEEEEIKLQVLIRVAGRSQQEVEAAVQEEARRDRGAGRCAVIGRVWREGEEEGHVVDMLSARCA